MDSKHQPARGRAPPPLPPRQQSSMSPTPAMPPDAPPSYDSIAVSPYPSWTARNDPRASSSDSLTPNDENTADDLQHQPHSERRRKLLCVYVHGFMGNETSFRSFPAHVHNLLVVLLSESHAVHTKIYPRYRSRRNITNARDDFSTWLTPHEGDNTDVVLLGHSMGGLVIAEVALMPSPTSDRPLKHRIVGTVNFDVPFLGMHPGVVKSGLASIFSAPPEEPKDRWQDTQMVGGAGGDVASNPQRASSPVPSSMSDGLWRPETTDPNYNPSFQNDVSLPVRKGWSNAWHFISKHSDNLREATKQLVTSHLEFGGAMANYGELKTRYARLRALEEESDAVRKSVVDGGTPPRVRFVNYYTASTGRPKKPKTPQGELPKGVGSSASLEIVENSMPQQTVGSTRSPSPGIKLEEHDSNTPNAPAKEGDNANESENSSLYDDAMSTTEMRHIDPTPADDDMEEAFPEALVDTPTDSQSPTPALSTVTSSMAPSLPPIPDMPTAPPPLDVGYIEDKQTRKLVEKEHSRATKAYEQAVKERERMIRDRAKLVEKRERKEKKDNEKAEKEAQKARVKAEKEDGKHVKKMVKAEEKESRELSHSEKEEKRLADERERMEKEGRRMRGEPEPEAGEAQTREPETPASEPSAPPTIASSSTSTSPPPQTRKSSQAAEEKEQKPPKDRKFCTLPPKDSQGQRDPCWPRVFMKDVDEVGAHCGLFFVDERYETLVGDVAERIEGWVKAEGGIEAGMERMRMKS
jgi:pimeloyl-ACP methyl ester carboxylesterase